MGWGRTTGSLGPEPSGLYGCLGLELSGIGGAGEGGEAGRGDEENSNNPSLKVGGTNRASGN